MNQGNYLSYIYTYICIYIHSVLCLILIYIYIYIYIYVVYIHIYIYTLIIAIIQAKEYDRLACDGTDGSGRECSDAVCILKLTIQVWGQQSLQIVVF